MKNFHSLSIKEIIRETPKAVSIVFDVPNDLKPVFKFTAGQYITIKKELNGEELRRSYSLCSTPQSEELKVTVKEVEGGRFSAFANNQLQVGESLDVFPPEGKFVFEANPSKTHHTYAAFAAGSGITPIMSIIKTALTNDEHSKFVLVYGNRTPEETIFFKELLELQATYANRFFVEFVYSRAKDENSFFGRIEKSTVNFVMKNKFKGHQFNDVYLCGPEEMINLVSEVLAENNFAKENIHFELFSSSDEGEVEANLDGKTQITVIVDDEEKTFIMDQKKNILDAVLDEDLDAPYSCQGGICSSCIARITEGKAEMAKNQILTDDEIEEGLTLTCQAYATTPTIKIDFDDV
ncbi:ring-1,2-phenylacetyl-CoA epoxidase subunit PaaE [Mesonia phycicola]|uniref:Ring-1,2-phenylacetyl-CoA epoxidase subunit PaaE n=1 Tax=Mesonia phycicola TaxID=579105 RepID=A0A1M6CZT2_9FLAO|nr:ferredoxin--NADP reductase [Mesonia phycicola]SHI66565.1 ring-1,2-phenylacetyl-CoA epoxidase subunit PaaE [Mesonia phycicola]